MGLLAASSARISQNPAAAYLLAFLAIVLALLARWALAPMLGDSLPFVTLFPAVVFASWFCGVGPSALGVVVGILGARYWFIAPQHSLAVPDIAHSTGLLVFAASSALIMAIGEFVRGNTAALQIAQGQLEQKVQQRTTELNAANHNLSELSARLLRLQDEERRRIARELHDSVGQTLAALSMNLSAVGGEIERLTKTAGLVADSVTLVNDMSTDIRTISYLLHPPLLDELGLRSAISMYVEGFSKRSGVQVDLQIPESLGRLPVSVETTLFRVVQQSLSNIYRHSGSTSARIEVDLDAENVTVNISDQGSGISAATLEEFNTGKSLLGVGVAGMRERIRDMKGRFDISSNKNGTTIHVSLPVS